MNAQMSAKEAGLRYVTDAMPGISRIRTRGGFRYRDWNHRPVQNRETIARIRSLAIPPAWTDVWICPIPNGHLLATGRDARNRKQYRYHPRWREVRDETKYHRLLEFGWVLPKIRAQVERDLGRPGLPREKVLATIVRLMEVTLIRVGNDEYAAQNDSYGLTTLRDKHVRIRGSNVHFGFRGKSGVRHAIDVNDRRLARIVKRCRDLPGYELFQYVDERGEQATASSSDVNDYLRGITQGDFTAKDFRTWFGTVLAARGLRETSAFRSQTESKRNLLRVIEAVALCLGNTKAVCKRCYIHPVVMDGTSRVRSLKTSTGSRNAREDLAQQDSAKTRTL